MAGPNPIVIDFIVKDLNKVLQSMRSIQDVALGIEKRSSTAAKAGADERTKARKKELEQTAQAATQTASVLRTAEQAGTVNLSKGLRTRLSNQIRHMQALKAEEDKHVNYQRKLRDQWAKESTKKEQAHFDYQRSLKQQHIAASQRREQAHFDYQRKLKDEWLKHSHKNEQEASKKAIAERKRVEKDAQSRQDFSVDVHRKLEAAERRAHFDAKMGGNADPRFSPQARLRLLRDAKHLSPEEKLKALRGEADMREEAKIANKRKADIDADAKRKGDAERREQDKTKREAERADKRSRADHQRDDKKRQREADRDRKRAQREEDVAKVLAAREVSRSIRSGVVTAGSLVSRATKGAFRTVTDLGGGFDIGSALQDEVNLDRQAALISVNANVPKGKRVSPGEVKRAAKAASIKTGIDATELAAGLSQFQAKTGDFQAGAKNLEFFGKVSKVSGASVSEIMATMGQMTVQNKQLQSAGGNPKSEADMKRLLLSTIMQSRQGAVDPADLAKAGARVTRSAGMYTGDLTTNQSKLIGLSQIGMRTAGSVHENATVLANIQADALHHKEAVKDLLGRDFQDEQGRIKGSPDEFVQDLFLNAMASKGGLNNLANERKTGKQFLGARAQKFFQAMELTYGPAKDEALGMGMGEKDAHEFAAKKVREDVTTTLASNYTAEDMNREFADIMKSSAEKFEGAVRELKVGVAERLLPEVMKLIPVLQALTPALVSLISFIGKLTGTENDKRTTEGVEATIQSINARSDLRAGPITPEKMAALEDARKRLTAQVTDEEAAAGGGRGAFDKGARALTSLFTAGTFDKRDESKRALERDKAELDALTRDIAAAVKAGFQQAGPAGGPPPPRVPTGPVGERGHYPP